MSETSTHSIQCVLCSSDTSKLKQVTLKLQFIIALTPHISSAAASNISHAFLTHRTPPNKSKQVHFTVPGPETQQILITWSWRRWVYPNALLAMIQHLVLHVVRCRKLIILIDTPHPKNPPRYPTSSEQTAHQTVLQISRANALPSA